MKKVIIQDTWNFPDDQDLLEYTEKMNRKIISKEEFLLMNLEDIDVPFFDTSIIQSLLKDKYQSPRSYPKCFEGMYGRLIFAMKFEDILKLELPFFIKPYENNKNFIGTIIRKKSDLYKLDLVYEDIVYVSSLVNFVNEFRIFMELDSVHGMIESSEYLSDYLVKPKTMPKNVGMDEFIKELISKNSIGYCVIDIAQTVDGDWLIVEVNPPFAISSYDYPIDKYFDYCKKAWLHILEN